MAQLQLHSYGWARDSKGLPLDSQPLSCAGCWLLQAAARSHAAREAELNSREAGLEAAQQQLEQQSQQLQVRAAEARPHLSSVQLSLSHKLG